MMADLAVALETLEAFQGLGERDRAAPMQQIEVDPVGGEPFEAALAGGDHTGARGIVGVDFADNEQLIAHALGGTGDDLLSAPAAVHLGSVDQGHAETDPEPQRRRFLGGAAPVLAHVPGSLTERRHLLATAQGYGSQLFAHLASPTVC